MKQRKAGFTLIELIVAIAMACILLAALAPLLTLAQNGSYKAQRSTRASQAGEAIYEYTANLLKTAERVYIGDGGSYRPADWESWNRIQVSLDEADGVLTVNGTALYPLEYQEDCSLALNVMGQSRDQLQLSVALSDNRSSETLYLKRSALTLSNLEGGGFGQIEGIVGDWVAGDGFESLTDIGTAAGVGQLVIYFKGGAAVLPEFDPGGGPDHPEPTPGAPAFSLALPARMEVELGQQATLSGFVTWPAGVSDDEKERAVQNARWEMISPAGAAEFLSVTGSVTAAPSLQAVLHGLKVTDGEAPVTVKATLSVNAGGKTLTATGTCLVSVWSESGIHIARGEQWNQQNEDLSGSTLFFNRDTFQSLNLTAYTRATQGKTGLSGVWTSSDHSLLPDHDNKYNSVYTIRQPSSTGVVTLTFTANGGTTTNPDTLTFPELKGKTASITLVFFGGQDLAFDLAFVENGQKIYTAPFTGKDTVAGTVQLTLTIPSDFAYTEQFTEALRGTQVQVYSEQWWASTPYQKPSPQPLGLPAANKYTFTAQVPIRFLGDTLGYDMSLGGITARILDAKGNVIFDAIPGDKLTLRAAAPFPLLYVGTNNSGVVVNDQTLTLYKDQPLTLCAYSPFGERLTGDWSGFDETGKGVASYSFTPASAGSFTLTFRSGKDLGGSRTATVKVEVLDEDTVVAYEGSAYESGALQYNSANSTVVVQYGQRLQLFAARSSSNERLAGSWTSSDTRILQNGKNKNPYDAQVTKPGQNAPALPYTFTLTFQANAQGHLSSNSLTLTVKVTESPLNGSSSLRDGTEETVVDGTPDLPRDQELVVRVPAEYQQPGRWYRWSISDTALVHDASYHDLVVSELLDGGSARLKYTMEDAEGNGEYTTSPDTALVIKKGRLTFFFTYNFTVTLEYSDDQGASWLTMSPMNFTIQPW